ncbi:GNAT family N-acetyltransferase [Sphingomonas sp. ABOLD]|uniref:GNAT family N-acetyltransferase n=1 Tax=Sphingomonas TaxID=13687 RepID=UPI000F7DC980|nr:MULTISPECIES: GNAT family N-acetyltransferase [Sphingomonas]RSV41075.1 GNAT family N-acetyltransferase [Sphingomonas sp. ABOLD]
MIPVIRPAVRQDGAAIWAILEPVIRAGETYALDRDMSRDDALAYWLGPDRASFVAEGEGRVLGTYYLRANQAGGGAHVANCGYATHPEARGRGIARAMAEHSFTEARARGFRAMQFNFVVSSNAPAVRLWHALGFATVGRVPEAFEHPAQGLVDALVLYRPL